MPMHDWTRATPNEYHSFHLSWLTFLMGSLNNDLLPPEYEAFSDHTTPPYVPDVVTLHAGPNLPGANPGRSAAVAVPRATVALTA
ncbi:MAG: DUF4058 domain-containing protein, partial [Gemmataceae bacterium]|nr:DUF4058 domain-containing protein [Gemmataceae bacterium]